MGNNRGNWVDPSGKSWGLFLPKLVDPAFWPAAIIIGGGGYLLMHPPKIPDLHLPDINWLFGKPKEGDVCKLAKGKNFLPENGAPGTVVTNGPGTSKRKYGPDGKLVKDYNKGHPGYKSPEDKDHIHDYEPANPRNPSGNPKRLPGRPPTDQDRGDFGLPI